MLMRIIQFKIAHTEWYHRVLQSLNMHRKIGRSSEILREP